MNEVEAQEMPFPNLRMNTERRKSPEQQQRISQLLTGYGPVWLRREGDFAVVLLESPDKEWVEVIREHVDGPFSHIIEPSGIEAVMNRSEA